MGRCYLQLNLDERRKLAKWLAARMPVREIADLLSRAPCTIYREVRRNFYRDVELPELNGDHAVTAQDRSERRRAVHRRLIQHPQVMAAVRDGLGAGWSPEQIAGRMKVECHTCRVSHETSIAMPHQRTAALNTSTGIRLSIATGAGPAAHTGIMVSGFSMKWLPCTAQT